MDVATSNLLREIAAKEDKIYTQRRQLDDQNFNLVHRETAESTDKNVTLPYFGQTDSNQKLTNSHPSHSARSRNRSTLDLSWNQPAPFVTLNPYRSRPDQAFLSATSLQNDTRRDNNRQEAIYTHPFSARDESEAFNAPHTSYTSRHQDPNLQHAKHRDQSAPESIHPATQFIRDKYSHQQTVKSPSHDHQVDIREDRFFDNFPGIISYDGDVVSSTMYTQNRHNSGLQSIQQPQPRQEHIPKVGHRHYQPQQHAYSYFINPETNRVVYTPLRREDHDTLLHAPLRALEPNLAPSPQESEKESSRLPFYLGVRFRQQVRNTVVISAINAETFRDRDGLFRRYPAARAKLLVGDSIVSVQGMRIENVRQLQSVIHEHCLAFPSTRVAKPLVFVIKRRGRVLTAFVEWWN